MSEISASRPINIRPVPTDDEAAAIVAAVVAYRSMQSQSTPDSVAAHEPTRWSMAARREMTRSFVRTREGW